MQDQALLDRNPGLATLLTDLNTRFLTPTGASLHLDQDLHQARYALKHKKSYLETKTLFDPIERLRFLPLDHYTNFTGSSSNNAAAAADFQRDISTHLDRLLSILETRRLTIPSSTSQLAERTSRGIQSLFNTLNQTVSILWEMIVEFQIRYQIEQDQTLKEYFSQLVESLALKLE
ncbi:hypothetical protein BGX30_010506 [Mortierella sp. GBA39]|nr:hypothetical protein BGX30_010506 [Mortierella sp. GBA39]